MNEIVAEIHRHREQVARACDYDAKKLMDYYRRRESIRQEPSTSWFRTRREPRATMPGWRSEKNLPASDATLRNRG